MKRVLVVGANSYVGQKFNEYININYSSYITVDMVSATDGAWKQLDFSLYDSVLHLAAIVHRNEKKVKKKLYYNVNFKLAVDVGKKAKNSGVKQFLFMSTAAVYGNNSGCIKLDTVLQPITYYAKSKLEAELALQKLSNKEFQLCIIRPPMVYGKDCKGNYAYLQKLAPIIPIFPKYQNKRSRISIDFLSDFLAHLILTEKKGVFHPSDLETISTYTMLENIRDSIGKKTYPIYGLNILITFLLKHGLLTKIFGDFYYDNME